MQSWASMRWSIVLVVPKTCTNPRLRLKRKLCQRRMFEEMSVRKPYTGHNPNQKLMSPECQQLSEIAAQSLDSVLPSSYFSNFGNAEKIDQSIQRQIDHDVLLTENEKQITLSEPWQSGWSPQLITSFSPGFPWASHPGSEGHFLRFWQSRSCPKVLQLWLLQ